METTLKERREALKWWDSLKHTEKLKILPKKQSLLYIPIDKIVELHKKQTDESK